MTWRGGLIVDDGNGDWSGPAGTRSDAAVGAPRLEGSMSATRAGSDSRQLGGGSALEAHVFEVASKQYVAKVIAGDLCFSAMEPRPEHLDEGALESPDRRDAPARGDATCAPAASYVHGEGMLPSSSDGRGYASRRAGRLVDTLGKSVGAQIADGAATIGSVTFSHDGRWLRLGTRGTEWSTTAAWMLWNLQSGQPVFHPAQQGPQLGGDPFVFNGDLAVAPGSPCNRSFSPLTCTTGGSAQHASRRRRSRMPGVIFSADGLERS